jgi:hypothetical protein
MLPRERVMNENQISGRKMRLCYQVEVAGIVYDSLSLAACTLGISVSTVLRRCESDKLLWQRWKILRSPLHKGRKLPPRRVQVNRKIFDSCADAGRALKMNRSTVYYRAKRMLEVDGLKYQLLPPTKDKP